MCDLPAMRRVSEGVSLIAHLAAFKIPRYGKAIDTLLINSQGSHNILQLATERKAKFVLASTSDVYGKNPVIPFSEDSDSVLGLFDESRAGPMLPRNCLMSTWRLPLPTPTEFR